MSTNPEPPRAAPAHALVTGGAGFIGSHLVRTLLARGTAVRVLDDFTTGARANLPPDAPRLEVVEGDIRELDACHDACAGVDVVFHLAALGSVPGSIERPAETIDVNVRGTANVFAAARDAGLRRLVYASSSSVYGDSTADVKREGEEGRPLSPYAASKVMNEELAAVFARCYPMEPVGVRFFNVYGARQDPHGPYAAVVPRLVSALLAGEPGTIHGDGEQSRDFTYVGDAVAALLAAAAAPATAAGRAFNVGAGHRTTVNELERTIRGLVGGGPAPIHVAERPGDVKHSLASTALARELLGFAPATDLATGLQATLAHYRGRTAHATPA